MGLQTIRFASVLFTALAFVPAAAHLLELPNKIRLQREQYLTVQQIYRGWQFAGILVIAALVATFALTLSVREHPDEFAPALLALVCIGLTQAVFWTFTFPVNKRTVNWTRAGTDWEALRRRWEYSHAASAILGLLALIAVLRALLAGN